MKTIRLILFCIGLLNLNMNAQHENSRAVKNTGFMENKGQVIDQNNHPNSAVKYLFQSNGMNVQLKTNGFSYDTYTIEQKQNADSENENFIYHFHRIDVELVNANPHPQIITAQSSETYYNYFTTGTPEGGVTNVHTYEQVTYQNIYPNIDLQFVCDAKKGFKYNFIVHPSGDYRKIKLKYAGQNGIKLQTGEILISTSNGNITESIPLSYLMENNQSVKVNYKMSGENEFEFMPEENYDATNTLVIDPTPNLLWGTYYGGSGHDDGNAMVKDSNGNLCIEGTSQSTNMATVGAWQATITGTNDDVFIAKFDPTTSNLIWGTYYGGSGGDRGYGICVDASNNVFVTGYTNSTSNIATAGAWKTSFSGVFNAFVAKFNSTGTNLVWGTYYGGFGNDESYAIALDASGNVVIGGSGTSQTNMTTAGAWQTTYGGGTTDGDAFIAKFNSTGTSLLWGTYYGGSLNERIYSLVLDASDNIFITGYSGSSNNIATAGSWMTTYSSNGDVFVAKFNSSGTTLLWGTYYGGSLDEYAYSILLDGSGNVYVGGRAHSSSGIATAGAWQTVFGGGTDDAFIAKFNSTGTTLVWGTYYGGSSDDRGSAITMDGSGNLYMTGLAKSTNGIATAGAWQTSPGGLNDVFFAAFNSSGSTLMLGTYYGGTSNDQGNAIVLDGSGNVFIAGQAASLSQLATTNAYDTSFGGGNSDVIVAKFDTKINAIETQNENTFSISAYPNPVSGELHLQMNNLANENSQIEIVNVLGQVVFEKKKEAEFGMQEETIDVSGFPDGIYFVNVRAGNKSATVKIVVER